MEQQGYAVHELKLGTHCGTHVDAPAHYIPEGKTVDGLSLYTLCGPCYVCRLEQLIDTIGTGRKPQTDDKMARVLFKTGRNGQQLDLASAQVLVEEGMALVGTEEMTIGDDEVHTFLLAHDVIIVENLVLSEVDKGWYHLFLLPLPLQLEAAPARGILVRERGKDET